MKPRPPHPLLARLRALQTPGWAVFFAAMLILSVVGLGVHLSAPHEGERRSSLGGLLRLNTGSIVGDPPPGAYYAIRDTPSSWRIVSNREGSGADVAQAFAAAPRSVVKIDAEWSSTASGLYDPPALIQHRALRLIDLDGAPVAPEDIPGLIHALALSDASFLVSPNRDVGPWALSPGLAAQNRTLILWPAVANNAIASLGLLGFTWSLAGIPTWLRRLRRDRRLAAGLCTRCTYHRAALPASAPCPECGAPFGTD